MFQKGFGNVNVPLEWRSTSEGNHADLTPLFPNFSPLNTSPLLDPLLALKYWPPFISLPNEVFAIAHLPYFLSILLPQP
jgi:hypothetical protein